MTGTTELDPGSIWWCDGAALGTFDDEQKTRPVIIWTFVDQDALLVFPLSTSSPSPWPVSQTPKPSYVRDEPQRVDRDSLLEFIAQWDGWQRFATRVLGEGRPRRAKQQPLPAVSVEAFTGERTAEELEFYRRALDVRREHGRMGRGLSGEAGAPRVIDLRPGDRVECALLVVRKELRQGGRAGLFLDLTLSDSSGRIPAKVWENAAAIGERFAVGDVVEVTGVVETYRNELQLRVEQVRPLPPEEADPSDFLPRSRKDSAALEAGIAQLVKSIGNEHLRELLMGMFRDQGFRKRFLTAPGAKALHHAYIGGLIEHTAEVVELCEKVCEVFPALDRDLLLTSAILHDVGKMDELSWQTAFEYTDEGQLLGHLVLGERVVLAQASEIEGFPEELKLLLSHMMLSHHGTAEFGSPKAPMTAEAIALHQAEDLDAKINMFLGQIETARERGQRWTERHFALGRQLYAGEAEEMEPAEGNPDAD